MLFVQSLISFFQFIGDVFVDVTENKPSLSSIYTKGLAGFYGFLVDGDYDGSPFCFLHYLNEPINPNTSLKLDEILCNLKVSLNNTLQSKKIILNESSIFNLSLFVGGSLQATPDFVRMAFSLLQNQLDLAVKNKFEPNSEELFICQQLNYRTTIIDAIRYLLLDDVEDYAAKKDEEGE